MNLTCNNVLEGAVSLNSLITVLLYYSLQSVSKQYDDNETLQRYLQLAFLQPTIQNLDSRL